MSSNTLSVPFNRPSFDAVAHDYLADSLASGKTSGDGPFTKRCRALLEEELGCASALLTTSCTHALEMSALLLDIKPGDEVIVPSFTFVSTANAFALRGAKVVFCDVRRDTLNMDESILPSLTTPRTRAIVPVHYAGIGCEMDVIMDIAGTLDIPVIEDNAHGLFAKYRGRYLGTFGAMATQSFHETKNFSCGEGGALLINDPGHIERAEIVREKGTNRSRFFRGQVDKYTWVDLGSSYLPADILAALLFRQLERREAIQERRAEIWNTYATELAQWAHTHGVILPTVPETCEQAFHLFYMLLPSLEARQAFIAHMRARGVLAVFHYLPLHLSEFGRRVGGEAGQCPVTEDVSDRLVRLPLFFEMSDHELAQVLQAALTFAP
ncbi:MAG: dTDP-4-amino-4,6-dideoxygalactose transaminase [Myxococcota bacterium]